MGMPSNLIKDYQKMTMIKAVEWSEQQDEGYFYFVARVG
jgi:hypothetical protein